MSHTIPKSTRSDAEGCYRAVFEQAAVTADGEPSGMGLLSMRERAELLGGQFRLRATPGAGTFVEARLPLV